MASGLKCSVASCTYKTSDTVSDDTDIGSKIKLLEIHTAAAHQAGNRQDNAGGELDQQVGYRQDYAGAELNQQVADHQVGYGQDNAAGQVDQQSWINQSFPNSNLPIVQVPNDAEAIYNINIPHPDSSNEFENVLAEPTPGSSKNPKNVETVAPLKKRKLTASGNKEKKGRYDERELNTPSPPPPAKPPTPCYQNTSLLSCVTQAVMSPPPQSPSLFSSTYADDNENRDLSDEDLQKMLEDHSDDENQKEDEDIEEDEVLGKDYSKLFNEDNSFVISDHESLRRSLKFQTYLCESDRLDPTRFASFMVEFAAKVRALNEITMDAHKNIDKEHHLLFSSILVSHFSKWTGLTFLNEAEMKKKNSLELSIKNFDSRILGTAKIIKGKKGKKK